MNRQLSILATVSLFLSTIGCEKPALSTHDETYKTFVSITRHAVFLAKHNHNSTSRTKGPAASSSHIVEEQRTQPELATAPTQEQRDQLLEQARLAFDIQDVSRNWFVAKNSYMFKGIHSNQTRAPLMLKLLQLRTAVLCQLVFDQVTEPLDQKTTGVTTRIETPKGCLHDGNDKAKRVPIPKQIPMVPGLPPLPPFTEAQQACVAMAIGSLTYVSDLDFTVMCKGRKSWGIVGDTARQQALDEIIIAERLTTAITQLLGQPAGIVFDTNFYTNTFDYAEFFGLDCSRNNVEGVAMAMYAAARGFTAVAHFAKDFKCASWNNPFGVPSDDNFHAHRFLGHMASVLDKLVAWQRLGKLEFSPNHTAQEYFNETAMFVSRESDMSESDLAGRTAAYFAALKLALDDKNRFCKNTALALMFANEAYWVPAAIKDVVFHETITPQEGMKSVFMNLGFAMEHAVHEFTQARHNSQEQDIRQCQLGDGVLKFGKYMRRVESTCNSTLSGMMESFAPKTKETFKLASSLLVRKKNAFDAADTIAMPKLYRDVAHEQQLPKEDCKFVQTLVLVCADILETLLRNWPLPQTEF